MRRDLAWRSAGAGALAIAALISLAHRSLLAADGRGPASAWELLFGLGAFIAASIGVLLLIHGAALFQAPAAGRAAGRPVGRPANRPAGYPVEPVDGWVNDGRAMAALLAARELARARDCARNSMQGRAQDGALGGDRGRHPAGGPRG